jgi:hypothetical protein
MSQQLPQHFPTLGLQAAFLQEDFNGFGFQTVGLREPGYIAIACIPDDAPDDLQAQLRQELNSHTVTVNDFIGNYFLTHHFTEWSLIPDIFRVAITKGCNWISPNILHLAPRVSFTGQAFSFEEAERLTIEKFETVAAMFKDSANPWKTCFELLGSPKPMRRFYNYRTEEGKMFCAELCAKIGKPLADTSKEAMSALPWWFDLPEVDAACREYEVLHYAAWSKRELKQAPNKRNLSENEESPKRQKKSSELTQCVVCMEHVADTIVLPCQHIVVCHLCSVKLAQSHFAKQCIYCRQAITEVLTDEKDRSSDSVVDLT